jgi:hypothetical protein
MRLCCTTSAENQRLPLSKRKEPCLQMINTLHGTASAESRGLLSVERRNPCVPEHRCPPILQRVLQTIINR